jgi:3-phenylpropionate/trans-cinnamate dioxygenase ferredoxin subunit
MRKVGRKEDFPEGKATAIEVDGHAIVVCHVEGGKFYAVEDRCSHDDEELSSGDLEGCDIVCPRHGARFDVRDGTVTAPPAIYPIDTYEVKVRHGEVYVQLDP